LSIKNHAALPGIYNGAGLLCSMLADIKFAPATKSNLSGLNTAVSNIVLGSNAPDLEILIYPCSASHSRLNRILTKRSRVLPFLTRKYRWKPEPLPLISVPSVL